MSLDTYEWADNEINSCPKYETGFTELLAAKPYPLPAAVRRLYDSRLLLIRSFQKTAVDLFRAALRDDLHPGILHWLINEAPDSFGVGYHRRLEDRHFSLPVFFRTDEVRPGRIIEINSPAALWGELQLVFEHTVRLGCCAGEVSPADQYAAQLTGFLGGPPVVHHFLDKSSAPGSWRYFIEKTRPRLRYLGIDRGVRAADCNFIRYQTFVDLEQDENFPTRLSKVDQGVTFDSPPYMLFDQKATLVLPFWSMTRTCLPDDIRALFPFTTPLLPTGIELQDGRCITFEDFSRLPRSQRAYYLKYAGSDWILNYGSRAVYRLSNLSSAACLDFLRRCLSQYDDGHIWLLQQEETRDDEITYLTRDGRSESGSLRAKFAGFYGPAGCLGVLAMHSRHNKVHGQPDTVLSYVLAEVEDRNPA
ncbi:MAG: hypothetical protein ABSF99_01010 [Anaerolineales bacterium]